MEKFTRVATEVTAIQWFPYKMIEVEGFKNVIEELTRGGGMDKVNVVMRAEIEMEDKKKLSIFPTDWVVLFPGQVIMVMKSEEFMNTFVKNSDLDLLNKLGSADDLAKFGLKPPTMPKMPDMNAALKQFPNPYMPTYPAK